jgi:hypothetical protein
VRSVPLVGDEPAMRDWAASYWRGHPTNPVSIRLSSCMRSCSASSCAWSFTPTWCAAASAEEPDCSDLVPAKAVADQAGLPSGRNNPKVGTIGVVPTSEQRRVWADENRSRAQAVGSPELRVRASEPAFGTVRRSAIGARSAPQNERGAICTHGVRHRVRVVTGGGSIGCDQRLGEARVAGLHLR